MTLDERSNGRGRRAPTVWKRWRLAIVTAAGAAAGLAILGLAHDARVRFHDIDRGYGLAASIEHEMGRLESGLARLTAVLASDTADRDLRALLVVATQQAAQVEEMVAQSRVLWEPSYVSALMALCRRIEGLAARAEAPGAARTSLAGELPALVGMATDLSERARRDHERQTSASRAAIGEALLRLVGLTSLLVAALSAGAVQLLRLYRRSRVQADMARKASLRLETIFRVSADAILVTDPQARIIDFNRAAMAIFGHSRERLLGEDALALLLPPEDRESGRQRVVEALRAPDPRVDGPLRLELEAIRADGTRFPVEVSLAAGRVGGDDIIVALLRDISARRRAERELTEARDRALAGEQAKADFLAVISHEMRTPLNGLAGSIDLLAQTPLDDRQKQLVSVLSASAGILLDHVNAGLDIARSEARPAEADLVDVDLDRLIEDCVANQSVLAAAGGNRIESRALSGAVGVLRADPARLRQVLLNLIGNAVKFTRGGRIEVETALVGHDRLEIRVTDTGIGIDPADQARIFDDFVTLDTRYDRRSGGTGLGLGIARRLVRMMGGELSVESTPGKGSRFTVALPLRRPPPPAPAPAEDAPLSVLVIDDNDINRFIAQTFLESAGHEVVAARSGFEGLDAAAARRFDVVLTDISMPGLDGLQVARRIRDGGGPSAGSRILALTAHSLGADADALRLAGIDDCLQKPIKRATLLAALGAAAVPDADLLPAIEAEVGPEAFAALLRQMILDGDAIMARLEALGRAPDPEAARRLAHQMAGAVSTFGEGPLHRRLQQVLTALRAERTADEHLAALPGLWRDLRAVLAGRLAD